MTTTKRQPASTPETKHFWDSAQNGVLALQQCRPCDRYFFYPRSHCPFCLGVDVRWTAASGRATLHTYVIAHHAAPGFEDEVPYAIAIVELEEGPRMMTNIVGVAATPESLQLDMPLEVVFVDHGAIVVPNFRPSASST